MWNQNHDFPKADEWKQFKSEFEHQKDCIVCACDQNETNTIDTIRDEVARHFMLGSRWFEMMVRWVECFVTVTIYFEEEVE